MESVFFRRLAVELGVALDGARVEKVYLPVRHGYLFTLSTAAGKRYLHFHHGRGGGALFLSQSKADAPKQPGAWAMWLRKRLTGTRLRCLPWDWSGRRALFGIQGLEGGLLVLDMRHGPTVEPAPAPYSVPNSAPDSAPYSTHDPDVMDWPDLGQIRSDPDIWRVYPHLSPLLRRTLALLPEDEASVLLRRVREDSPEDSQNDSPRGSLDTAYVYHRAGAPAKVTLWPLPPAMANGLEERMFDSAGEAARFAGESFFYQGVVETSGSLEQDTGEAARTNRILRRLDQEAVRLREKALPFQERAEALKARLHQFAPGEKRETVEVEDGEGGKTVLSLDPSRTVVENMERWFHQVARAKRGLDVLVRRRAEVLERGPGPAKKGNVAKGEAGYGSKAAGGKATDRRTPDSFQGIARFLSGDGFVILRGKNSAANHRLLTKVASPFDLWFHAQDGPGAHCILRRDHPGMEVPESSLAEAAMLAGLKSWLEPSGKGDIICALAGDVRAVKGAALGRVRVDKVFRTLRVALDSEIEARLAAPEFSREPSLQRGPSKSGKTGKQKSR
jgi:hypothetical protein